MKWDEACDASVNDKAKRDNGKETWLIIDRTGVHITYELVKGFSTGKRTEIRGPVARVLLLEEDDDGEPFLRTAKMITIETIEKFDDWRPSVPRPVVEEVTSLDNLDEDLDINEETIEEIIKDLDTDAVLADELGGIE